MKSTDFLNEADPITRNGAAVKPIKGLYNARVGDILEIGVEGFPHKIHSKIAKIGKSGKLMDTNGNIFDRSGKVYRRKGYELGNTTGKIVWARHMTQKQLDKEHDKRRREFLKTYDWNDLDPKRIEEILKILRVSFGDIQKWRQYV